MSVNIVTLKSRLKVTQGHRNRHVRSAAYHFLLMFYSTVGLSI